MLDTRLSMAPLDIVFCSNMYCNVIRRTSDLTSNLCPQCQSKLLTLEDIDITQYGGDIKNHRNQIKQDLAKFKLVIPPNVEITLFKASQLQNLDRMELIMKAHTKAELAPFTNKTIKITLKQVQKCTDTVEMRNFYYGVYGADAGSNLTLENMRQSLIAALNELVGNDEIPLEDVPTKIAKVKPVKPTKTVKLKLFNDRDAQIEREQKYPWCIPESWHEDPNKPGSTLVNIKCIKCGKTQSTHAAELFHIKTCKECK
jgi:hypothetical protein